MFFRFRTVFGILSILCVSLCIAQNYQCPWSVVDIGGGVMSSTGYQTGSSVGQTAVGLMSSSSYQSFVGFWQIDTGSTGVREESHWSVQEPLITQLYAPFPNPCPIGSRPVVRYSLASGTHVTIRLFDLVGRNVRTLVNAEQKPGRYSVGISRLGRGIYFVRLTTPDLDQTRKLVLTD